MANREPPRQAAVNPEPAPHRWPLPTGTLLIAVCWPLNWLLPTAFTPAAFLFFPLWFGYILVIDGLVHARSGTSILARSRKEFWGLFLASMPCWWLFEIINRRTKNWEYLGAETFNALEYFLLCSVAFSTVMPAVLETAELVLTFRWTRRFANGPRLQPTRSLPAKLLLAGVTMLSAVLLWPRYCYPLVWGAVFLLVEPMNILLGRRHLFKWLALGDWRPVIGLSAGVLLCGFCWEMWNSLSYPKWIYHTPGAEFLYIFEMPLLGYLGYVPFAWELFSLRNLMLPAYPIRPSVA